MGWTTIIATHYKDNGTIDRLKEIYNMWEVENHGRTHVLKMSLIGRVVYGAIQNVDTGVVWGLVALTSTKGNEFGYKDMDDTCGPNYYNCPLSILKLLTPTNNENANNWRKKCYENANAVKLKARLRKSLSRLPLGTHIEFVSHVDLHSANPNFEYSCVKGDTVRLVKRCYGNHKEAWYDEERAERPVRWKDKWLSDEYTVLSTH